MITRQVSIAVPIGIAEPSDNRAGGYAVREITRKASEETAKVTARGYYPAFEAWFATGTARGMPPVKK